MQLKVSVKKKKRFIYTLIMLIPHSNLKSINVCFEKLDEKVEAKVL